MMERLGVSFARAPLLYGWRALATWARHLPEGCATYRAQHPEESAFSSAYGRAMIAADQFDAITSVVRAIGSAVGARTPSARPYPRPNDGRKRDTYGADAVRVAEFDAWYYDE